MENHNWKIGDECMYDGQRARIVGVVHPTHINIKVGDRKDSPYTPPAPREVCDIEITSTGQRIPCVDVSLLRPVT